MPVTHRRRISQAFAVAVLAALCLMWALPTAPAGAAARVTVDFFVESLSPYGDWADHPRYGRVWHPRGVPYDWRPYTVGRWVWTEEHGWMWVSDEEWGWGPYHYGRWDYDESDGWIWIPDDVWGPAWVEWRSGEGYIGWAPLPPAAHWVDDRIVFVERFDIIAPRYRPAWVFVADVHFVRPRVYSYCVPAARNVIIINKTVNVTNYTVVNRTVINKSVNVRHIETVTKAPVPIVKVAQVNTPAQGKAQAGSVAVFKPIVTTGGKATVAAGISAAAIAARAKAAPAPSRPAFLPPADAGKDPVAKRVLRDAPAAGQTPAPQLPGKRVPAELAKADPRANIKEIDQQQEAERAALRRRHHDERAKARFIDKPGMFRDQLRERAEQRRIQERQRQVFQNKTKPPPGAVPRQQAPLPWAKKPPKKDQDPNQSGQPPVR